MDHTISEPANSPPVPSAAKPWLKYYSEEARAMPLPKCSLYSYLRTRNADHTDANAIHYYGTTITYGTLLENIDQCADAFYAMGVRSGDIVTFISVTTPETVYAMYALNKIGAVSNFVDPRMDTESIFAMIDGAGSDVVVTIDLAFPKLKKIMPRLHLSRVIVQSAGLSLSPVVRFLFNLKQKAPKIPWSDQIIRWAELMQHSKEATAVEAPYREEETAIITYTGGTTGIPKGVMLTSDSMNAVAMNFAYAGFHYNRSDRFLDIMPVFASYGVVCGLHMPLILGLETVLIPRFVPNTLGKLVRKYRCNHMLAVPAFYEMMMSDPKMKNFDLSFIGIMGSGGDTMNPALEEKLHAFMQSHGIRNPIAQGYGMSEVSAAASFCFENIHKPGSVGIPSLKTTIGIFRPDTTEELGTCEDGEVCISGPTIMKGYYNNPEETDIVLKRHPDGQLWVHSGDIGYLDEDGFLFVHGRVKHMVIRFDGHKVFPLQIETFISRHPAVHNCAVIGVPDREHGQGQYPLAVVELQTEEECGKSREELCRELFDACNAELEERGRPVAVVAVDEMPATGLGKNNIKLLTEQFRDYVY